MTQPITATCTPSQLAAIVRHHLRALAGDPARARQLPPLMAWGPPGVGKSAVLRAVAEEEGVGFLDVRLAQREPVDLRGIPVPDGDSVRWLVSSEWPRDPDSRGILLFDEITAADRTVQVAAYELLLDRRLGDLYTVPPGWVLAAAGNRVGDRAVAGTMSSALANRFCHLEVGPDLDGWVGWANARGLHPAVTGFLRYRPELFLAMEGSLERGWPSPRSWERVAHEVDAAERVGLNEGLLRLVVSGLVGPGAAHEFMAFRTLAEHADARAILEGTADPEVPPRADQRYALAAGLAWHLWRVPGRERAVERFLAYGLKLPSDVATLALVDALRDVDADVLLGVLTHAGYAAWSARHGAVLGGAFLGGRVS